MQTKDPAKKVVAGSLGGGIGGAFAEIFIFLIEKWQDLPPRIETAITVIVVAAFAFGVGYYTPPGRNDGVVPS
jgi:fructose-specific phosphotransferase system IIC component